MTIEGFPCLSADEFARACQHLTSLYHRVTAADQPRLPWELTLHMGDKPGTLAHDAVSDHSGDNDLITHVRIRRVLDAEPGIDIDDNDDDCGMDENIVAAEDADQATHIVITQGPRRPYVLYEIHLHPTYRVPCLWFSLHGLAAGENASSPDTVFRYLVPHQFRAGLTKGQGGVGGISLDHHPITALPAFFVHPCLTGDGMAGFEDECDERNYLVLWIGLTGGPVGLFVPMQIMAGPNPALPC